MYNNNNNNNNIFISNDCVLLLPDFCEGKQDLNPSSAISLNNLIIFITAEHSCLISEGRMSLVLVEEVVALS